MTLSYSSKRRRDAEFIALCDNLPDDQFGDGGVYRDALKALQNKFLGRVIVPSSPDYDQDRKLSNPVFDFHPLAIIYCTTEVDVGLALQMVRNYKMQFSVRSGGHCTAGFSGSNGVIIDVKELNSICILKDDTAIVGCGVEFGHFQQVLDHHGLNVPGGECSDVCVGGYVQGGGFGFTAVKYGMSCDNITEVRVMLADGSIVVANADQNADLLWAICGGTGGNFGVLLTVKFTLHKFRIGYGFALSWSLMTSNDIEIAANAMMAIQEKYMLNSVLGSDMTLQIHIGFQNVGDGLMAPFLMLRGMWAGDPKEGPTTIAPLKALPGVLMDDFWEQVASFYVLNHMLLNRPQGMPPMPPGPDPLEDKSSHYVSRKLEVEEWVDMLTYVTTSAPNKSFAYMEVYGGAINAAPKLLNSFVHRDSAFNLVMDVFWRNDEERATSEKFLAGWDKMVQPYWNGEVYQNYPSIKAPNYATEFWGAAYPILQRVKAKYDPGKFFHFDQNVVGSATVQLPGDTPAHIVTALKQPPLIQKGLSELEPL